MKRLRVVLPIGLITSLLSTGCNAILDIDEHKLARPASADPDTGAPDVARIDGDTGLPQRPDGSVDPDTRGDVSGGDMTVGDVESNDRRDTDVVDGGGAAPDGQDSGGVPIDVRDAGNTAADASDSGNTAADAGDAGSRIVVLRGTISTMKLAPASAGNVRLIEHGIGIPWKSCNAWNCVSGGIAP